MMFLIGDYKTPNEELYSNIQKVYEKYYKPVTEYGNMKEPFDYLHATECPLVLYAEQVRNGLSFVFGLLDITIIDTMN